MGLQAKYLAIVLVLLVSSAAHADTITQPSKYAKQFIADNRDNFTARPSVRCWMPEDLCEVTYSLKPNAVLVPADDEITRRQQMKTALQNWDSLTAAQKDALLKYIVKRILLDQ